MTVSGGRRASWAHDSSGVRNSGAATADPPVVLPRLPEKFLPTGHHAEGAICEVFKAHHVALDIAVAVKVLKPEYAADPKYLERMRIEAQVLPRLRSPHIVHCFDRGITEDGRPFTVLEFLRGETLESLLGTVGTFDELVAVELGAALLEALSVAHTRGIVHRDVSLRNLIVHRTEHEPSTLKLIDFGFAWIMPDAPESAPEPAEVPDLDVAVGTPRFTSPEVALGHAAIDGRADLYSTGVVLYTLLAGRDPFAEFETPEAVLEAHAHRPPPPLSHHARTISKPLEHVVMRLLEKNPAARYPTASEAAQALLKAGDVARDPSAPSRTVPPSSKRRQAIPSQTPENPTATRLMDASDSPGEASAEPPVPGRRLITRRFGALLILLQRYDDPADEEWDECLDMLLSGIDVHHRMKVLVRTDGGGVTASQRARLLEITRKGDVWVSVISDSARARFVVSAVAFLQMRIRSFDTKELRQGCEHLKLTCSEQLLVSENLAEMAALVV